jgi:hypothetical protein
MRVFKKSSNLLASAVDSGRRSSLRAKKPVDNTLLGSRGLTDDNGEALLSPTSSSSTEKASEYSNNSDKVIIDDEEDELVQDCIGDDELLARDED